MTRSMPRKRYGKVAVVLIALALAGPVAIPGDAWARPAGSHESNQGEMHKVAAGFWAKFVKVIKVHIVRPIVVVVTDGGSSSPTCR